MFHGTGRGITVGGVTKWARTFFESGSAGNSVTVDRALQGGLQELNVYGWCKQDGTPTPVNPVDIECNNGVIKYGKPLTLDPARYYAYIGTGNYWSYSTDSYSIVIPVTVGKKYRITADPTTPVEGNIQNAILRWGFVDTIYDNWKQTTVQPSILVARIYDWVRSTPQETQSVEVTATHSYMILQMGAAAFASNLTNGRVGVAVQEIYTDGTSETLTVTDENGNTLTVTMPMLLGVGNVYDIAKLVEKIKSGKVGIFVSDGTANWTASETPNGFTVSISGKLQSRTAVIKSTHFEYNVNTLPNIPDGCVMSFGTTSIGIKDTRFSTVEALNAEHAAHPVIFIYPVATETSTVLEIVTVNFARWLNTVAVNKVNSIARNLFDGYYKKML